LLSKPTRQNTLTCSAASAFFVAVPAWASQFAFVCGNECLGQLSPDPANVTEEGVGWNESSDVDGRGRWLRFSSSGRDLRLAAAASLSLVLPSLQENRLHQSASSRAMHVRRERARGLFLRSLRKLEHGADRQTSLCLLLLQEPHHRGRVQLRHAIHPDAQS
jgi:hypothetical protein